MLPEAGRDVESAGFGLAGRFSATLANAAGLGTGARAATRGIIGRGSGPRRAGRVTQPSTLGVHWPLAEESSEVTSSFVLPSESCRGGDVADCVFRSLGRDGEAGATPLAALAAAPPCFASALLPGVPFSGDRAARPATGIAPPQLPTAAQPAATAPLGSDPSSAPLEALSWRSSLLE